MAQNRDKQQEPEVIHSAFKILELIKFLSNNSHTDTSAIATYLDDGSKNALRYINTINKFFKEHYNQDCVIKKIEKTKSSYRVLNKDIMENLFNFIDVREFVNYINLMEEILPKYITKIDSKTKEKIESIKDDFAKSYLFKSNPLEEFNKEKILKDIETAVGSFRKCDIYYMNSKYKYIDTKPIKILFAEGNLYLVVITDDDINNGLKLLRISFIDEIKISSNQFNKNDKYRDAINFIENDLQTPFTSFELKDKLFRVKLKASKNVARFFEFKKHFPSQETTKNEDGSLIITYYITQNIEILPFIKKWLPDLSILEPQELKDELKRDLEEAIQNL